jgi:hypothetical protein
MIIRKVRKNAVAILIFFAVTFYLVFPHRGILAAENDEGTQDKVIAYTFRLLAKGFVAAVDLGKLKTGASTRISKMDDAYFRARYLDIYEHVYEQPLFTKTYGLDQDLTKAEAIAEIQGFDKPQLYALIDAVPDVVITNEFKRYLWKKKEELPKGDNPNNFIKTMSRMIDDFKRKYLPQ